MSIKYVRIVKHADYGIIVNINDRRGYQEVCSDCEAYGLTKHGLTRYDCMLGLRNYAYNMS